MYKYAQAAALTSGISEDHLLLLLNITYSIHFSFLWEEPSAKNAAEVVLLDKNENSKLYVGIGLSLSPSSPSPQYPPRGSLSCFVARSAGASSSTLPHWIAGIQVPVRTLPTLVLPSSSSTVPPTGCPLTHQMQEVSPEVHLPVFHQSHSISHVQAASLHRAGRN